MFPSISAAWVFCQTKYTRTLAPAPTQPLEGLALSRPGHTVQAAARCERPPRALPAGSDRSRPAERPAALCWAAPECWGRASCAAMAQLPVNPACRTRTPPPAEGASLGHSSPTPAPRLLWDLGPLRTVRAARVARHGPTHVLLVFVVPPRPGGRSALPATLPGACGAFPKPASKTDMLAETQARFLNVYLRP